MYQPGIYEMAGIGIYELAGIGIARDPANNLPHWIIPTRSIRSIAALILPLCHLMEDNKVSAEKIGSNVALMF